MSRLCAETEVDPAPLVAYCERLIAEGHTWGELAIWCGYKPINPRKSDGGDGHGDGHVLKRRLGMLPDSASKGMPPRITALSYPTAVKITRGLGLDPVDVGI